MTPNLRCIGIALAVLSLTSCETDTSVRDEYPDPVLVEYPLVYIERDIVANTMTDEDGNVTEERVAFSSLEPTLFNPGARLILQSSAFAESTKTNLTESLFEGERIDIRDLVVSDDGSEVLMSLRAPAIEDADEEDQPKWNIWRYTHATQTLAPIILDERIAEQGDDLMPQFLPDGRIIFASTRQQKSKAILLDEGKPQYNALVENFDTTAINLHIMSEEGTNIEQLTFNLSHDFYPLVMQDGYVLYSRWDLMGGNNRVSLYKMRPDGTENQIVYGWHSQEVNFDDVDLDVDYVKTQQLPNGQIFISLADDDTLNFSKRPVTINITDFIDTNTDLSGETTTQSAQQDLFANTSFNFDFDDEIELSGAVTHVTPLRDGSNRLLLSWSLCRVVLNEQIRACGQLTEEQLAQDDLQQAEPLYELWLYDQTANTQKLVASTSAGSMITESAVLQPNANPVAFLADKTIGNELDAELANEQAGAIDIRSVYDLDGEDLTGAGISTFANPTLVRADERPARFLKIIRGVPMPPEDVRDVMRTDFGRSANQLMRDIVGYTPIQPDGSVKVKVPANVPLALSIVDAEGKRISARHRHWFSVLPGETLQCNGCHSADSEIPHGRTDAEITSINVGATADGVAFPGTNSDVLANFAETMAQAAARTYGIEQLSSSLQYSDIWTDESLSTVNPSINLTYSNLSSLAPNGAACFDNWTFYCRLQINYSEHIQPIWSVDRQVFDEDTGELVQDNTCITCHAPFDSDNVAQVPEGQLDLTETPSLDQPLHLMGYRELFFNDNAQEVVDGILLDQLVEQVDGNGDPVFQRDEDGELILDAEDNPIPVLVTVNVANVMSTAGANASDGFFDLFTASGSHAGRLSSDELRLIAEWLDIGAQYYNTPFYQTE